MVVRCRDRQGLTQNRHWFIQYEPLRSQAPVLRFVLMVTVAIVR
jgi:hypothetical protein